MYLHTHTLTHTRVRARVCVFMTHALKINILLRILSGINPKDKIFFLVGVQ